MQQTIAAAPSLSIKLKDYSQLVKLRLNLLVVFSTVFGYLLGTQGHVQWGQLLLLALGGFLTVGAANTINQIIERDTDKLMRRTQARPIAQNRVGIPEAVTFAIVTGVAGVLIIGLVLHPLAALLSVLSLVLYGFVYTPLKKVTPLAVHIGAVPGALPSLIGYVAASGMVDEFGLFLFAVQFLWQFPHFYAIAWLLDDDYKRAGLKMQPIGTQKGRKAAIQTFAITALLVPLMMLAFTEGFLTLPTLLMLQAANIWFVYRNVLLIQELTDKAAKRLMFASFLYLPIFQIILLADKLWLQQ